MHGRMKNNPKNQATPATPTKEEVAAQLRASTQKLLDNLLAARDVAPEDISEEDRATLDQAIAKAEKLLEGIEAAFKKGDIDFLTK